MYTNADQLPNKITALQTRTQIEKPDVIVVVEVNNKHASNLPEPAFYNIPGYQMHTKNLSKGYRGILIYTINSLSNVSEVCTDVNFSEHLMMSVNVNRTEKLLLCALYRSESGSEEKNENLL